MESAESLEERLGGIGDRHEVLGIQPIGERRARRRRELQNRRSHRTELIGGGYDLIAIEVETEPAQEGGEIIRRDQSETQGLEKLPKLDEQCVYSTGHDRCVWVEMSLQYRRTRFVGEDIAGPRGPSTLLLSHS